MSRCEKIRSTPPHISARNGIRRPSPGFWPCKLALVPSGAPYFDGANLVVAADCTAYAYIDFYKDFSDGAVTLILCPKLSDDDYQARLKEIISKNDIKSVTLVRMDAECCQRSEVLFKNALKASGKFIPWQIINISTDGKIIN